MADDITLEEISAVGINSNFSILKDALKTKANQNGDSTQKFKVADAIESTEAINKGQLDSAVSTISSEFSQVETEIATKADKSYVDSNLTLKANETDMEAALAKKADLNGSTTQVFNVADATVSTEAINKGQLDNSIETINGEIIELEDSIKKLDAAVRFSLNSGNLDVKGDADLLSYSGSTLSFKVGGSYPNLVGTNANGKQFTRTIINPLDCSSSANGLYNVFVGEAGNAYMLKNTILTQPNQPTSAIANDVWLKTLEPLSAYKYDGTTWNEFLDVPLGKVTIASNLITEVTTNPYNQNGYNINKQTVKKYDSGWFAVTKGTVYTKTHGLGTSNIKYIILIADDTNGTNQRPCIDYEYDNVLGDEGWYAMTTTANTLSFKTAGGCVGANSEGGSASSAYYRILAEVIQ